MSTSVESDLLKTLPCIGPILSMLIALEIGDVERFPGPGHRWIS